MTSRTRIAAVGRRCGRPALAKAGQSPGLPADWLGGTVAPFLRLGRGGVGRGRESVAPGAAPLDRILFTAGSKAAGFRQNSVSELKHSLTYVVLSESRRKTTFLGGCATGGRGTESPAFKHWVPRNDVCVQQGRVSLSRGEITVQIGREWGPMGPRGSARWRSRACRGPRKVPLERVHTLLSNQDPGVPSLQPAHQLGRVKRN